MIGRAIRRLLFMAWALLCFGAPCFGLQDAIEYALKSGTSTTGAQPAPPGFHLGVCPVNSRVFACVSETYPKTTVAAVVILCFFLFRLAMRRSGSPYQR